MEAPRPIEYLAVANTLPWLPAEPIETFRREHYPTAHLIEAHLTVVFPVPATIGRERFAEHVRDVISKTPAFDIRLNGLGVSWDHWLYLKVAQGREQVVALHDALYTGILRPHLWTERRYVPHVGLGHFAVERDTHDPLELRPRELDRSRLGEARRQAEALRLDHRGRFEAVHIFGLDEALTHVTRLEEIGLDGPPAISSWDPSIAGP